MTEPPSGGDGPGEPTSALRAPLRALVERLAADHGPKGELSIDDVGEALGARAATPEEISLMLEQLEARGLRVTAPEGGDGEKHLIRVLDVARGLRTDLGRAPTASEIAHAAQMPLQHVKHALELAKILQR